MNRRETGSRAHPDWNNHKEPTARLALSFHIEDGNWNRNWFYLRDAINKKGFYLERFHIWTETIQISPSPSWIVWQVSSKQHSIEAAHFCKRLLQHSGFAYIMFNSFYFYNLLGRAHGRELSWGCLSVGALYIFGFYRNITICKLLIIINLIIWHSTCIRIGVHA